MGMDVGGGSGGALSSPNVVPLIDILLVLIIIFMVITPLFSIINPVGDPLPNLDIAADVWSGHQAR